MVQPLGIGLIGHGGAGKIHALGYRSLSSHYSPLAVDPRLVGVCTSSEITGEKAQEEHGYEFHCTDYRHLLESDDISLIDCCAPNFLHRDVIIDAIKAGKHIYCEKPLAMNLKEAEEIVKFSRQSAVKCQIVFNYRFIPAMMRAKQLAEVGSPHAGTTTYESIHRMADLAAREVTRAFAGKEPLYPAGKG